jgi:CubicO group peptidase (beta-lactamase class C family)
VNILIGADVLAAMLEIKPVVQPYDRPLYSQLSFQLLSYVMNTTLGSNYTELLHELVVAPLNLTNTGASPGNDSRAVIPPVESSWGANYGDNAP